jgi:hypothetical protein
MKKITILLLSAVTLLLASCDTKKAKDFNDKLVGIQKEIINEAQAIMKGPDQKANKIKANDFIKQKLAELEKVEPVKGGEAFKSAMVDDIKALSQVYEIAVKLEDASVTPEAATKMQEEQQQLLTKINTYDNEVLEQQRKFAKDKGFKLEYK